MARSPRLNDPVASPRWSRRGTLGLGGLVVLSGGALAGCSVTDPTLDSPSRSPGPTGGSRGAKPSTGAPPAPLPGYPKVAAQEQSLAELARAVARRKAISKDQAELLKAMVAAHTDHARVLASAKPTERAASTTAVKGSAPGIGELSTKKAIAKLVAAEGRLAAEHRKSAVAARGLEALLWGSLAVAAEGFGTVDGDNPPPGVAVRAHKALPVLTDVAATQQIVAQLHALVYGYQLAIGKIGVTNRVRGRALSGLLERRVLRDRLVASLTQRKADIPTAKAAYVPSTNPTDAGSAAKLLRGMETAFLPFCGLWLAAAGSTADRELALTTLRSTARTARSWGAGARPWPGYPD